MICDKTFMRNPRIIKNIPKPLAVSEKRRIHPMINTMKDNMRNIMVIFIGELF